MKFIKIVFIIIILASLPYYKTVVFDFQAGTPFIGSKFYNPYETITNSWIKANFHAHSKLYFGIANGENTPEEMYCVYDNLDYDLACISNYNSIIPNIFNRNLYIPIYEHGRNFGTKHQLVINSNGVNNYDFFLYQNKHHKQAVINKQKECGQLITLAHPSFKKGYTKKDVRLLNNYDLFEGLSVRASSIDLWDIALTNGHAVWITGSDDAHSNKIDKTGVCWTMINTTDTTEEDVINSLVRGACYAQRGWQAQEMHRVKKVSVNNDIYSLELSAKADSIILKSDFGKTVAVATDTNNISYKIQTNNTYIRAEIFESEIWNSYTKTYLNPVVRSVNGELTKHNNRNTKNLFKTWLVRFLILITDLVLLFLVLKMSSKRKRETN